ncbi:universal stress protein [Steroidobacter denitrificans]|uniref:Universal stress protein n=1 Tax=Steroidobacter denitrificans TaxID=465721 RepID=A0A127FEG7_STEDE|nr:DUF2249 domain-containing protein [Steroidobacter denitrificans]AMN48301.1 universal stress protein [Steroidobacter denitrificans]
MSENFIELDVRPILRSGGEPFDAILGAVKKLEPGQGLRLFATFKPIPLFRVLGSMGFDHEATELSGGDWQVEFTPAAPAAGGVSAEQTVAAPAGSKQHDAWPAPAREMDNRNLDPPEPMVRILAAIEEMPKGEVLAALLCREPVFLLPELAKRGHSWQGAFEPDGKTYRMLIRIGTVQPGAA